MLGGYAFTAYKSGADRPGTRRRSSCSPTPRARKAAKAAVETARIVSEATALARDWVNTPAGDLTPEMFADAVVAEQQGPQGRQGQGRPVLDDQAAARRAASAASSASARARRTRPAWCG